jgi:hypothetical protein
MVRQFDCYPRAAQLLRLSSRTLRSGAERPSVSSRYKKPSHKSFFCLYQGTTLDAARFAKICVRARLSAMPMSQSFNYSALPSQGTEKPGRNAVLKGRSFSCAEPVLYFRSGERASAHEPYLILTFSASCSAGGTFRSFHSSAAFRNTPRWRLPEICDRYRVRAE